MTDVERDLLEATARTVLRIVSDMPTERGTEWKRNRMMQPQLVTALNGMMREKYPQLYSGGRQSGNTVVFAARPSDTVSPQD